MVEKICDYCKKLFDVPNYKKDRARFCSRTCGGKANRGKHPSAETLKKSSDAHKNPFKTGRIKNTQLICKYCQKPYKTFIYYKDKQQFCSNQCRINAIKSGMIHRHYSEEGLRKLSQARKGKIGWNRGKNTRVQIICEKCKKPFEVDNYRKDKAKFCSIGCSKMIDGRSYYPYCHKFNKSLKEKVRNRDNRTCQLCGVKENGVKLPVHHIHYDKENCYPDLISLCCKCNSKVNKISERKYYEKVFMNKLNERGLLFWAKQNDK